VLIAPLGGTPLCGNYDSKGLIPFDPGNSVLNRLPTASNWP